MLTSFFRCVSHSSISSRWKICLQGKTRTLSPFAKLSRQIMHSTCDENHAGSTSSSACAEHSPRSRSTCPAPTGSPSCFSHPVPVQTRHGKPCTTSAGARSRCAARAARMRCTMSVRKVRDEGMKRMVMKVTIGLWKFGH